MIGDSISLGWMPEAQEILPEFDFEHGNYSHINNNGTRDILAFTDDRSQLKLDFYLQQQPTWDLVIINAGIHDMRPFTHVFSTPTQYENNLHSIFDTLSAQPAPVLWLTTTPIPDDHPHIDHTIQPTYRAIELQVSQRADYRFDLYSAVLDDYEDLRVRAADLHFSNAGSQVLAEHITEKIVEILVPPDHDAGGNINGQDYLYWQQHIGNKSGLVSWLRDFGRVEPDFNIDGSIDGQDFLYWQRRNRSSVGLTYWEREHANVGPDFDASAQVNGQDFLYWQQNNRTKTALSNWEKEISNFGPDFDADGSIDGQDFLYWQSQKRSKDGLINWGQEFGNLGPDFDDSGSVNGKDFLRWQQSNRSAAGLLNWESNYETNEVALLAVPEPTTLSICLLGIAATAWLRFGNSRVVGRDHASIYERRTARFRGRAIQSMTNQ